MIFINLVCVLLVARLYQASAAAVQGPKPQVTTKYGVVQGYTDSVTATNTPPYLSTLNVDVFKGIPYAKPPIGALRFQPPQPPATWTGVKDTSHNNVMCIQSNQPNPRESEDCLYLNLERPVNASNLPVMFYIHGGGFTHGSKGFAGSNLASKGVIIVSINYRLGPIGFLSTEDARMPGNYGSLDQLLALQWVQDNIAAFGGDPNSVTIFGESAGSACVSLLILSPLSKGLFHRAIMMSGVASTSRDVPPPKMPFPPKVVSANAGQAVGCDPGSTDFVKCLQRKDVNVLYTACTTASRQSHVSTKWSPRVETTFGFMPDYPLRLIDRGEFMKIDTIRGFNAQEQGHMRDPDNDGLTKDEFEKEVTKKLSDMPYLDPVVYQKKITDLYLGNITDMIETRSRAIEIASDFTFILATILEAQNAKEHNSRSKSFLYDFNYLSTHSKSPEWMGVTHGANMKFVSGNSHYNVNDTDAKVATMVGELWTNFAKFSNPTPHGHTASPLIKWLPLSNGQLNYLMIDEKLQMKIFNGTREEQKLRLYSETMEEYKAALAPALPVVG